MIDPGTAVPHSTVKSTARVAAVPKLLAGAIFGLAFGFLLQKGGVGKFNVLIGQLLLQDFTVGLLFGAGFALMGYCPGTAAVALGQGNWDAFFGMAGLVAGSWIFAELSGWTKRTIEKWGNLGKVLLPDLLHLRRGVFVVGFALTLTAIIVLLERFTTR